MSLLSDFIRQDEEENMSCCVPQVSASAVLEDSEAVFADIALRLEKTKAEVRRKRL